MLSPIARHYRRTTWVVTGLEAGAMMFLGGLVVLSLNPFWHFDEAGLLDGRLQWWNAAGEVLIGAGALTEAVALVGLAALIVSRFAYLRTWPYVVGALLLCCTVVWVSSVGFIRSVNAQFEWNAADGFSLFRVQAFDEGAGVWRPIGGRAWQSTVAIQIQPLLRGYFKLNDWQKMNGDIGLKVVRIIPVAWPVKLGSSGENFQDPDENDLMLAAAREDLKAVRQILSAATVNNVNALDQTGQTALILACQNPNAKPDVVKALLSAGADANLRSRNGYTALTWSQARHNVEISRLLRQAGGRP